MKRLLIYVFAVFAFSSCSLNLEPANSVTYTNYFKSDADIEALVISMMSKQRDIFAPLDGTVRDIISLEADNEDIVFGGNRFQNFAVGFRNLESQYYMGRERQFYFEWKNYYDVIYIANLIIENEYRFKNVTPERTKYWIQQANFYKAQMYFELARNWGDAPIALGTENTAKVGKSPQKEVLNEALRCAMLAKELPTHEKLVDSKGAKLTIRQYATKGTVYTLLANIYAYMGSLYNDNTYWVEAEKCASEVIENRAGFYDLEPTIEALCSNCLGKNRASNETIFSIEISTKDFDYSKILWVRNTYPTIRTYLIPGVSPDQIYGTRFYQFIEARIKRSLVLDLFDEQDDQRRTEYWDGLGREKELVGDRDIYYAISYKLRDMLFNTNDAEGAQYIGFNVNRVVWRLADLILLRGECRARLGLATAVDDLNRVRNRAGLGNYKEGGDIRKAIFKERKRELYGEGHRFHDAVRNGYYSDLGQAFGALTPTDIERGALYYPVADAAFKNNDLMRQNTYWLWKQ